MDGLVIPPYTIYESSLHVQGLVLLKSVVFVFLLVSMVVGGPFSTSQTLAQENPAVLSGVMLRKYEKAIDETADIKVRLDAIIEAIEKAETLIAEHPGTLQGIQLSTQGKFGIFDLTKARDLKSALERGETAVVDAPAKEAETAEPTARQTAETGEKPKAGDDEATALARKVAEQLRANGFQPNATEPSIPTPVKQTPTPAPREELTVNIPRTDTQSAQDEPQASNLREQTDVTGALAVILVEREGPVRDDRNYRVAKSASVVFGVFIVPDLVLVSASSVSNARSITVANADAEIASANLQLASKRYQLSDQDLAALKLENAIGNTIAMIAPQTDGLLANQYLVAIADRQLPASPSELKEKTKLPRGTTVDIENTENPPIAALDKCSRVVGLFTQKERSPTEPRFTASAEIADFLQQASAAIELDKAPCPR